MSRVILTDASLVCATKSHVEQFGTGGVPSDALIAEDGVTPLVAEDGVTILVQE